MSAEEIPQEVRSLIVDHIESVVQLEALLLLHNNPQKHWSPEEVGKELRIEPAWAREQLAHLQAHGLLTRLPSASPPEQSQYRFGPASAETDRIVSGLAESYADRRVSVITLIFSKPVDRLRSFADAFKLRKDPPRG